MAKKKKIKGNKKRIFEQVNLAFKNPVRADILNELSQKPQRPKDLADNIGVQKQAINYHLKALKSGGLVKVRKQEFSTTREIPYNIDNENLRGVRINGISSDGNIQISYGVELTEDGRRIAETFVNRLYIDSEEESEDNNKKKRK
ncbi:MAG: ArsR/SmtB family transcription factor [Promethearchaeota archaeon]